MDGSVKLFHLVQHFYQTMGISSSPSMNWRNSFVLLTMIVHISGQTAFFLFEAATISDLGASSFGISSTLFSFVDFSLTLWHITDILKLIELCEKFIHKSMFYTHFTLVKFWRQTYPFQ